MANRKAPRLGDTKFSYVAEETVEDAAVLYAGEMIELVDSSLEVRPATAVSGTFVLGVNTKEIDNTDDGEVTSFIESSILGLDNAGNITRAHIGDVAYVVDSSTVGLSAASAATTNVAGRIVDVDDSYVYVDFDPTKKA